MFIGTNMFTITSILLELSNYPYLKTTNPKIIPQKIVNAHL